MVLNKKHITIAALLPLQIVTVHILSKKTEWIEVYYSNGLYPYISKFLRSCFGWLPFSFGDALGILLLIVFVKEVAILIKQSFKNVLPKLIKLTAFLSVCYGLFYLCWGLNYFRKPLATTLQLTQSDYTDEELLHVSKIALNKLHKAHLSIVANDTLLVNIPYSLSELYQRAEVGYDVFATKYPDFEYRTPSVKSSLVSLFQSYNGTSGYINPLTNEAQINNRIPKTGMPATICHEIAHQIGWAAENEANFIGFLTCISNQDVYFNYSGYRMAFRYCYVELRKRDKEVAKNLWNELHRGIQKDFETTYNHWQQYKNPIEPYIKKGYNSYLKANNQQKGIDSYSYVVDLLISYYKHHH